MFKRLLLLFLLCLPFAGLPAYAQTGSGSVTVSASNLTDSSGNPISNAVVYFAPVTASGQPLSYRYSGKGQTITRASSAVVTNGAFSLVLPDTSMTYPLNVCFSATVIDNNSGQNLLGPGYGCVQPAYNTTTPNNWCSSGACDFDNYTPTAAAIPAVVSAPTITVGTTTTLSPGSPATTSLTGTPPNYTLNVGIPTGAAGPNCATGSPAGYCQLPETIEPNVVQFPDGSKQTSAGLPATGNNANGALTFTAVGNAQWSQATGSMTSGSNVLTSSSAIFAAGDVGKTILVVDVANAGTGGFAMTSTITGYTDSEHVTLAANASANGSALDIRWGANDTAALQTWATGVCATPGVYAILPPKNYLVDGTITFSACANAHISASGAHLFQADYSTVPLIVVNAGTSGFAWTDGWFTGADNWIGTCALGAGTHSSAALFRVGDATTYANNVKVIGATFDNFGYTAVNVLSASNLLVSENTITGIVTTTCGQNYNPGINLDYGGLGGAHVRFALNDISGVTQGFVVGDTFTQVAYAFNTIHGPLAQHGMYVDGMTSYSIIGNIIEDVPLDCIKQNIAGPDAHGLISDNNCTAATSSSPGYGGTGFNGGNGLNLAIASTYRFQDITATNNTFNGFQSSCMTAEDVDSLKLINNHCYNTYYGIAVTESTEIQIGVNTLTNTEERSIFVSPDNGSGGGGRVDVFDNIITNPNTTHTGTTYLDYPIVFSAPTGYPSASIVARVAGNVVICPTSTCTSDGSVDLAGSDANMVVNILANPSNDFGTLAVSDGRSLTTYSGYRMLAGVCDLGATANDPFSVSTLGNPTSTCAQSTMSALTSERYANMVGVGCSVSSFQAKSYLAGKEADDGVVQMYKNGTAVSGATCTIGTGTTCSWSGTPVSFAATDVASFIITPDATSTGLDSVGVTAQCQ